jgi:hypothetical protein
VGGWVGRGGERQQWRLLFSEGLIWNFSNRITVALPSIASLPPSHLEKVWVHGENLIQIKSMLRQDCVKIHLCLLALNDTSSTIDGLHSMKGVVGVG